MNANGLQIGTVADLKGTIFQESTSYIRSNIYLIYNNLGYCACLLLAKGRSSVCESEQASSLASLAIGAGMCDLSMCLTAKGWNSFPFVKYYPDRSHNSVEKTYFVCYNFGIYFYFISDGQCSVRFDLSFFW